MGMSEEGMGSEVANAARGGFSEISPTAEISDTQVDAIWEAIAAAVVSHIVDNAVVTINVGYGNSSGSHTGTIS